jgi:hypothetical protein
LISAGARAIRFDGVDHAVPALVDRPGAVTAVDMGGALIKS